MLGHLSFGVHDLIRSAAFYDAILAPLGYARVWTSGHAVGFGIPGSGDKLALFAKPGEVVAPGPGFHLAFDAPNRAAVDAFHSIAIELGARDAGKPGIRPHYGPTYYAAFVFDIDEYKLEAVYQQSRLNSE